MRDEFEKQLRTVAPLVCKTLHQILLLAVPLFFQIMTCHCESESVINNLLGTIQSNRFGVKAHFRN